MDLVDVLKGLKKDGIILINSRKSPKEYSFSNKFKVATVDATGIAIDHDILVGGIPVVNTPILGAVPRILDKVTLHSIQKTIEEKWGGDAAKKNIKATEDAYNSVEVGS